MYISVFRYFSVWCSGSTILKTQGCPPSDSTLNHTSTKDSPRKPVVNWGVRRKVLNDPLLLVIQ